MAANKFATMLHRNTNKLTLILVYALLEWVLIVLLLLNALFSYLILRFADYFGLKRPCLWCSRIDHVFEPDAKSKGSYRDLVCEEHASEIGRLGYCSSHRKLAESKRLCEDCSSSSQPSCQKPADDAYLPWMKQIGEVCENGEVGLVLNCSCCGMSVDESKLYPNWGGFGYGHRERVLIGEAGVDRSDRSGSEFVADDPVGEDEEHEQGIEVDSDVDEGEIGSGSKVVVDREQDLIKLDDDGDGDFGLSFSIDDLCSNQAMARFDSTVDASPEIVPQHLEFFIGHDDHRLIPVELIDSGLEENQIQYSCEVADRDVVLSFDMQIEREADQTVESEDESELIGVESKGLSELAEKDGSLVQEEEIVVVEEEDELVVTAQAIETPLVHCSDVHEIVREMDVGVQEIVREMDVGVQEFVSEMDADVQEFLSGMDADVQEFIREIDGDAHIVSEEEEDTEMQCDPEPVDEYQAQEDPSTIQDDDVQEFIREMDEDAHIVSEEEEEDTEMQRDPKPVDEYQAQEDPLTSQYDDVQEFIIEMDGDVQEIVREMDEDAHIVSEEDTEMKRDLEPVDEYQSQEDPSTSNYDHGSKKIEQEIEFKTISVETSQLLRSLEPNGIEEDKFPDTPSSVDSLHPFNRRSFSLERRESGTESLDGSVISDIEPGEMTIEKLSSALRSERKALNALYAELDEERSASAVAASQTMAMINRLHEEKAAMQMEALQYQRMMDEQSEYDQEALQLLNELMVKREREKQELEKELEVYRRKVQDYEAREKTLMLRRKEAGIRSMTSSVSCSNAEDSDGSVDLNREVKEDDEDCDNNHNTPTDAVLYLEESLTNFEEERMSILEELKVLEERLFSMNSEEEDHFEDVKTFETGHENGNGYNGDHGESNGLANGHHKEMNGKHHHGTRTISKPKRLLPLFDAVDLRVEDGFDSASQHDSSDSISELESKRPAIEVEVDHVYERLQALESDREFLKHCMTSLKKGDKGVYLLQEILQHLRDLRNVDLRAKNMEDGII